MAANLVEICNMALDCIGVTNKIVTLDDGTKEANACKRWAATVRDAVLRDFPWPFASADAELEEITSDTETNPRWACILAVPSNYLKARHMYRPEDLRNRMPRIPFEEFLNAAGTAYVIGCDEPAYLYYTRKFDTDALVPLIPAPVVDALAWKLAARLVIPLAVESAKAQDAETMYRHLAAVAFADQDNGRQFDQQPDPDWIYQR